MKYLKTYSELNEGLRDKMKGKTDDDIKKILGDKSPIEQIRLIDIHELGDEYMPTKRDIEISLMGMSKNDKIKTIIEYGLDFDLLPRNKEGWCVYDGALDIRMPTSKLPNKLKVRYSLRLSHVGLRELPDDLIVGNDLNISSNEVSEFPKKLEVKGSIFASYNNFTHLPENFKVNKSLFINNNQIKELPKGLVINKILYLNDNNIKKLPDDLVAETVYIRNNPISHGSIKPEDVKKPEGVEEIKFTIA